MNEITEVVFYEKPIIKFERILSQHLDSFPLSYKVFLERFPSWFDTKLHIKDTLKEKCNYHGKTTFIDHHLAHAASAYYLSDFEKAAIVTIDGVGEWATTTMGLGNGKKIKIDKQINFPHSLGLLYSTLTSYLGFSVNDAEYKVMGLAAYGQPKPFKKQFDELVKLHPDGSYELNMQYFTYVAGDRMFSQKLCDLFGYPAREPESAAQTHYQDIAAALQQKLEEVVFHLLKKAYDKYKTPNLCLAGGVALNSVMNGKIVSKTPFKRVFIPPDPGDAGCAMGAALYAYANHYHSNKTKPIVPFTPYLGPEYPWFRAVEALKKHKLKAELFSDRTQLLDFVCEQIVNQKIIGWYQGKMEWGPRALGNRSILASAATEEMRDIINEKVKHRELFRPFAPVILEEHVPTYFKADKKLSPSAKWMLMVYPFKPIGKKDVPAVYHVDGTGRLQTLARDDNPLYYDLIAKHYQRTGVPIIINTSFNVRGEPIVCTPEDAVNCFLKTDIDFLVMGNLVVSKKPLHSPSKTAAASKNSLTHKKKQTKPNKKIKKKTK